MSSSLPSMVRRAALAFVCVKYGDVNVALDV